MSESGVRTVALPAAIAALKPHMRSTSTTTREALVFTGAKGKVMRGGNFLRAVKWEKSVAAAGIPGDLHFHDLRHTGNTLAAASDASARELMHRMGHASMRAALIYQYATSERDREIAAGTDARIANRTGKAPNTDAKARAKRGRHEPRGGARRPRGTRRRATRPTRGAYED
jgi:integrase